MTTNPPPTRREDVVDLLHGTAVPDPYRWLEDGEAAEVQQWVAEQNRFTRTALDANPSRGKWHERLCAFMRLPVVQAVQVRGDRLVLLERPDGAQQAQLVARSFADLSSARVLIDPADGVADAAVAIDWFYTSPDGSLVAYGVSDGGSEDSELRVLRTADGSHLDVRIPNCRAGSVAWEPDSAGFFYTMYPTGDAYNRSVRYHQLETGAIDGSDNALVWAEHPTPEAWPTISLSDDGRWLLVHVSVGWSRTDVHLLDRSSGTWADVIAGVDATSHFVFGADDSLIGITTLDAERGRVVSMPIAHVPTQPGSWTTMIPERDVVTRSVAVGDAALIVHVSRSGVDSLERWEAEGSSAIEIDGVGISTVVQVTTDPVTDRVFTLLTGFDQPASLWQLTRGEVHRVHPEVPEGAIDIAVSQITYPSPDGTEVGMFLIHRADVEPNEATPTILNGYGGFAITESPVWSATIATWCAEGGLYAIAGLRGGFEHGESWHAAGRREHKQNVFDDFHAAADWLVETGRTSRDRLAVAGGSNGGLLVGVALTQRPDLCRAVWCAVPLLDMVRFPQFLIARLWTDEYGDPDVSDEFVWLHAYSPYHHVVEGTEYPAVLLTAAEGDSRVDPLHARKMAAVLQHAAPLQTERPIYLHQESRAGHGVGKPVGKRADEQADVLAFLSSQLGVVV